MWCVPSVLNWIFKINLDDWSIKSVCDLKLEAEFYIEYIFQDGNSVWCVSALGTKIVEYNMETGTIKLYELGKGKQRNRGAVFFNKKIWIFPIELPGNILYFDTDRRKFSSHDKWKRECELEKLKGKTVAFFYDEEIVYMTLKDEGKIISFNLRDGELKIKKFPGESGLHGILKIENNLYVTSFEERILFRWNTETDKIEKYNCQCPSIEHYVRAVKFKNKILLTDGKTVDCFEIDTKRIYPYNKVPEELKNDYEEVPLLPLFFEVLRYDNKWLLIPWHANMLLEYTDGDEKWKGHILEIPEKLYYEEYVVKKLKKDFIIGENEIKISTFIHYIETLQDIKGKDGKQGLLGHQIYHYFI